MFANLNDARCNVYKTRTPVSVPGFALEPLKKKRGAKRKNWICSVIT